MFIIVLVYFKLILSSPKFLIPFCSMTLASLLAPSSPMLFQLNRDCQNTDKPNSLLTNI